MEITINLKTVSTIVAIVAVIIGIIEGLNVFSLSGLVPDFVFLRIFSNNYSYFRSFGSLYF